MQNNRAQQTEWLHSNTGPSHTNFCYAIRPDGSSEFDLRWKNKSSGDDEDGTRQYSFSNPRECRGILKLSDIESAIERCQLINDLPPEPIASPTKSAPRAMNNNVNTNVNVNNNSNNTAGNHNGGKKPTINRTATFEAMHEDAPNFDYDEVDSSRNSGQTTAATRSNFSAAGVTSNNNFRSNNYGNANNSGFASLNNNTLNSNRSGNSNGNFNSTFNGNNRSFSNSNIDEFDDIDDELLALDVDNITQNKTSHTQQLNNQRSNQSSFNNDENRMPLHNNFSGGDYNGNIVNSSNNGVSNIYKSSQDNYQGNASTFGESYDNVSRYGNTNNYNNTSNDQDTPLCPGHNVPSRVLTATTSANNGRQFYKCSLPGMKDMLFCSDKLRSPH